jgi:hypothetical protein
VDISGTPTVNTHRQYDPPREARVGDHKDALRATPSRSPQAVTAPKSGAGTAPLAACVPAGRPSALTGARQTVARQVQAANVALRGETLGWITWATRRHVDAGWTAADIAHAIEYRPDGRKWEHSGLDAARYPARALAARLAHWCGVDGRPALSRSQRAERDRHERAAAARVETERTAAARAGRATPAETSSSLTEIRAVITAARTARISITTRHAGS